MNAVPTPVSWPVQQRCAVLQILKFDPRQSAEFEQWPTSAVHSNLQSWVCSYSASECLCNLRIKFSTRNWRSIIHIKSQRILKILRICKWTHLQTAHKCRSLQYIAVLDCRRLVITHHLLNHTQGVTSLRRHASWLSPRCLHSAAVQGRKKFSKMRQRRAATSLHCSVDTVHDGSVYADTDCRRSDYVNAFHFAGCLPFEDCSHVTHDVT